MKPLAHIGDALIAMALILALMAGYDVKSIVIVILICEFFSQIFQLFSAFFEPVVKALNEKE